MSETAAMAGLDARKLRADFPALALEIHGQLLAYLDSANSSQKPRQVLDAMRDFYETSYANVHRAVYVLGERSTEGYEGAREKVRVAPGRALDPGDRLHAERHRGPEPRRVRVGPRQPRAR